ncbi:hypothetical protein ACHHYP_03251 [Achlya hypogyna]|uniref:Uncharacterized protein n=1 Tax=Achlya hypogyna TaxID=1202772 RepID=A0A1V9ZRE8_ACHHY|nr:hypothetical protein ACHHYP_03251 [Achlya hypogyna]
MFEKPTLQDREEFLMKVALVLAAMSYCVLSSQSVASHSGKYTLTATACEAGDCPHGGCYFEGGGCTFIESSKGTCPGGVCDFVRVRDSLMDGYCTGGQCTLDSKAHPSSFSSSLSE